MTPDTDSGEVQDPMTQKSYVWNGNNPVVYSDPSGYFYNGSDAAYDSLTACQWIPELQLGMQRE